MHLIGQSTGRGRDVGSHLAHDRTGKGTERSLALKQFLPVTRARGRSLGPPRRSSAQSFAHHPIPLKAPIGCVPGQPSPSSTLSVRLAWQGRLQRKLRWFEISHFAPLGPRAAFLTCRLIAARRRAVRLLGPGFCADEPLHTITASKETKWERFQA